VVSRVEPLEDDPPGRVVAAVGDPLEDLAVRGIEVVVRVFRGDSALVQLSPQPEGLMDLSAHSSMPTTM
jgi:hypothetical protein